MSLLERETIEQQQYPTIYIKLPSSSSKIFYSTLFSSVLFCPVLVHFVERESFIERVIKVYWERWKSGRVREQENGRPDRPNNLLERQRQRAIDKWQAIVECSLAKGWTTAQENNKIRKEKETVLSFSCFKMGREEEYKLCPRQRDWLEATGCVLQCVVVVVTVFRWQTHTATDQEQASTGSSLSVVCVPFGT